MNKAPNATLDSQSAAPEKGPYSRSNTMRNIDKRKFIPEITLVVIGGRSIDASSFIKHMMPNPLVDQYDPSLEISNRTQCVIDDEVALLDLLDFTNGENFPAMLEQYMRVGGGYMLVYSITSRGSFEELKTLQQQLLKIKDKDYFPVIVVGDRCDLEIEREVSKEEGKVLARSFGCPFIETSSEKSINVEAAFYNLVREVRRYCKGMSRGSSLAGTEASTTTDAHKQSIKVPTPKQKNPYTAAEAYNGKKWPKFRRYFPCWIG